MTMKRIGLISLGCPKNLIDSEAMLGQLVEKGYSIAALILLIPKSS